MVENIGVIGAGPIGREIAQILALSGYSVVISDVSDEILERAIGKVTANLEKLEKDEKLEEELENVLSRIKATLRIEDMAHADFIIECVKEKLEVKKQVLAKIGKIVKKDCLIATSTSAFSITDLAQSIQGRERFIGIHYPRSPVISPIVEIVMGNDTSERTRDASVDLIHSIGKDYALVKKDVPGFIVNRINERVFAEAITMLEEGKSKENIDAMMRYRLNFQEGLFEIMDSIGIDLIYNLSNELVRRGFNTRRSEILKEMVEGEKLGRKTGSGFFEYFEKGGSPEPSVLPSDEMFRIDVLRIISAAVDEAAWLLRDGVASQDDIEKMMVKGMNWPEGPFTLADCYGIDRIIESLNSRWTLSGENRYRPDQLLTEMSAKGHNGKSTGIGFYEWKHEGMDFGPVRYEKRDNYALIVMNRPRKLNALNEDMWSGLRLALSRAENDNDVRSVVLTGGEKAFSAGNDIVMMAKWKNAIDAKTWLDDLAIPVINLFSNYSKPIISAVNGYALGGAFEFTMLSDIVISSEDSLFSVPEGTIGALPPIAASYGYGLVSKKLGRYALTGEKLSAAEAKDIGIVDVVVQKMQLPSLIVEFTEKINRVAPMSSKEIKTIMNSARSLFSSSAGMASESFALLTSSVDFAEGLISSMRNKKQKWEGR